MAVLDETRLLEGAGCDRHAGAAGAEHHGEILVGERNGVRANAVVGHQEPTRAALVDAVQTIAGGQLPEHIDVGLQIAIQQLAEPRVALADRMKVVRVNPHRRSGDLTVAIVGRRRCAQEQGKGRHPFPADRTDLDLVSIAHARDDRENAVQRKIDVADGVFRLVDLLANQKFDEFPARHDGGGGGGVKPAENCVSVEALRGQQRRGSTPGARGLRHEAIPSDTSSVPYVIVPYVAAVTRAPVRSRPRLVSRRGDVGAPARAASEST